MESFFIVSSILQTPGFLYLRHTVFLFKKFVKRDFIYFLNDAFVFRDILI
jgi:hypothetical protein